MERLVVFLQASLAATLATIAGGAVLSPSFARRPEEWVAAVLLDDVGDEPVPVAIRVTRDDGHARAIERQLVFVVKNGSDVLALSSTCTHLGCRVSWHAATQELRCPCHGGVFDREGRVKAGPPPAPLAALPTRVEDGRLLVRV